MITKDKLYNTAIINVFKVKSDSVEVLREIVKIAFSTHDHVVGFKSTVNTLTLYWRECTDIIKFKKPLDEEKCFEFVSDWLYNVDPNDRQKEISPDQNGGDYGFGFKISSKGDNDFELFHVVCMNLYYGK